MCFLCHLVSSYGIVYRKETHCDKTSTQLMYNKSNDQEMVKSEPKSHPQNSQGSKVFPQNKFPIDSSQGQIISLREIICPCSSAFSCLQEHMYCVVSRFDNNYFVIAVRLYDRRTHCKFRLKFDFALFIYHSLNFNNF